MDFNDLATKNDIRAIEDLIRDSIQIHSPAKRWPMRMKKRCAAEYMGTSNNQIDNWVNDGDLKPKFDKNPALHPTTPAYFNKEDLDKIRLREGY